MNIAGFLSVVYIYITVGDPVEVPLTGLSLSHCCACLKPGHGFPTSYSVVPFINFVFSYLYILFCGVSQMTIIIRQAQQCDRLKPVNGTSTGSPTVIYI
jgi:hypothetical protein